MNKLRRKFPVVTFTILALAAAALPAQAQLTPTALVNAISNSVTLNAVANAYTNLNAIVPRPIDVPQTSGVSVQAHFVGSSTLVNTNVIGLGWALSVDGTNYCNATNQWLWSLIYPRGTTTVYSQTMFTQAQLQGARKMKLVQVTNDTFATTNMTGTLSGVWVGKP